MGRAFFYSANNTVMVHIRNLRKKLEADPKNPKYVVNVWERGTGLSKDAGSASWDGTGPVCHPLCHGRYVPVHGTEFPWLWNVRQDAFRRMTTMILAKEQGA